MGQLVDGIWTDDGLIEKTRMEALGALALRCGIGSPRMARLGHLEMVDLKPKPAVTISMYHSPVPGHIAH